MNSDAIAISNQQRALKLSSGFSGQGGRVLLAERSGTGYADGAFNLPSGKLEPGEDVVAAVIREAREEIGVHIERDAVRAVHVMHHRSPEGQTRVGWFFTADRYEGEPYNAEPHKCAGLLWVLRGSDDVVPCCVA
jgi:8-oxo-dGTP diphosphatase